MRLAEFHYLYFVKEHDSDKGRVTFACRQGKQKLILGLPTNNRGSWKKKYFFVKSSFLGDKDIPRVWSIPLSKNSQEIVKHDTEERIKGLFELSEEERHWEFLLTPIWELLPRELEGKCV